MSTDLPAEKTAPPAGLVYRLTLLGLVAQAIYLVFVVAFPLISNTQAGGPAADLEILMRDFRWFAPLYVLGVVALYVIFWQAMRLVSRVEAGPAQARLKRLVLAFGLLHGFTLVWMYPVSANDLFRYVLRGRLWAVYGASPMITPPNAFPNDPFIAFAGEFGHWTSGYGPLWELLVQVPLRLGAVEMTAGAASLKLLVWLCYAAAAWLIGWRARPEGGRSLAALTFFAWNPLVQLQVSGNGHNDMAFLVLVVLGLVLWQSGRWFWVTVCLALAAAVKASAWPLLPLFGVVLLRRQTTWRARLAVAAGAAVTGLAVILVMYRLTGPFPDVFRGVVSMLTVRRGYAIASAVRVILREILPWQVGETVPRATARYIFLLYYLWLLWRLWQGRLNLVSAAFLAYFAQLMLGPTFRIWYPLWLVPLAALHLTPATFWRTFLFGLTAELSIVNYFVVWRWWLKDLPWDALGLRTTAYYWSVMYVLTVPWLFGLPLFGPIVLRWRRKINSLANSGKNPGLMI